MPGEELLAQTGPNFRAAGQLDVQGRQAGDERANTILQPGAQAASRLGDQRMQQEQIEAQKNLAMLKFKMGETQFPPELAIQMSSDFSDPTLLQMAGQPMNARLMGAFVAEKYKGMAKSNIPKITQIANPDGTVQNAMTWKDVDGTVQMVPLGSGIKPEKLHPPRPPSAGRAKDPAEMDFKKKKEFMAQYNKRRAEYSDPIKAAEAQKTDPDKYSSDIQWLKDNQDTYDGLTKEMSQGSNLTQEGPAGNAPPQNNAPFDADAFIKEATGG